LPLPDGADRFAAHQTASPFAMTTIYKICPAALWEKAEAEGVFRGSRVDRHDGFIHFSTGEQVEETAAKHFAGEDGLVVVAVDSARLGDALRFEKSRGGALFPHLHFPLDLAAVLWVKPLPLGGDGHHVFPDLPP
jgi:uncharacterized protein (DUF952 family)